MAKYEYWTHERLRRAALEELCRHGGTATDVRTLLEQFKQAALNDEDRRRQADDIPD
jgi:hypothetical protein